MLALSEVLMKTNLYFLQMLSVKPDFSFFSICGGNLAALNFQEVKS